jgi:hypothetical protein
MLYPLNSGGPDAASIELLCWLAGNFTVLLL